MNTPIEFRWLGVAGIELQARDQTLVIDPFFTRPPFRRVWLGRVEPNRALIADKIPRGDFVLVTHPHWDHLLDVPDVARNTGAVVLGSRNTCELLQVCGVPKKQIREIRIGDTLALGDFGVEVFAAEHGKTPIDWLINGPVQPNLRLPLRLRDYRMDVCFSFLIEVEGLRLLDSPRTAVIPADVLFVATQEPRAYYESLLPKVHPRVIVPIHWDDLMRPLTKPLREFTRPGGMKVNQFATFVQKIYPEARVLVPEMFRVYELGQLVNRVVEVVE